MDLFYCQSNLKGDEMDEKYFEELKLVYTKYKKNYSHIIEKQRENVFRQEKMKGKKYNVFPYKQERLGNKLNGKEVAEIEMKDDNYIYSFDEMERIILIEEASTFLGKIYNYECYDYVQDRIYGYRGDSRNLKFVQIGILENGKVKEIYAISDMERFIYEKYDYNDGVLESISQNIFCENKEPRQWKELFYFDEKNNLKLIQTVEGVHKRNNYCAVPIAYKKLDKMLEQQIVDIYQSDKNNVNKMDAIEINLYNREKIPNLDIYLRSNGKGLEKKQYPHIDNILLRKYPLDDEEEKKIISNILKSILRLWDEKILAENVTLKVMIEGADIEENLLPEWIKKKNAITIKEDKFKYNMLQRKEKKESMGLKDIFKVMKRVDKSMSFEQLVFFFKKIASIEVIDIDYEEELLFMQSEVVTYKNKLMFGVLLVRQIPFGDEYIQLGMQVIYELNEKNKGIGSAIWSDCVEGDFFSFVRKTEVYQLVEKEKIFDVQVFMEET